MEKVTGCFAVGNHLVDFVSIGAGFIPWDGTKQAARFPVGSHRAALLKWGYCVLGGSCQLGNGDSFSGRCAIYQHPLAMARQMFAVVMGCACVFGATVRTGRILG